MYRKITVFTNTKPQIEISSVLEFSDNEYLHKTLEKGKQRIMALLLDLHASNLDGFIERTRSEPVENEERINNGR